MKLSDFKYNLPKTAIAKYPVSPRDKSKLLVVHKETGEMEDKKFTDVINYMEKGDVLVVNETRVFQARLYGKKEKTQAKIEVFLLRELNKEDCIWDVIVDPARKVRIGNKIYFDNNLWCEVIDNTTSRGRTVRFNQPGNVFQAVEKIGLTPLPPYIKRDPEPKDKENYQTVYAKVDGAVAAPTAGLHFTTKLLEKIQKKGIHIVPVILHIGLGTFRPVEVEDLTKHKMDSEYYEISAHTADVVNKAMHAKHNIVVVGTSACRALETSTTADGFLKQGRGWTDKFIYPPHVFHITQKLITNFHSPESTLLMLASALGDTEVIMKAYKKALKDKYRFLSYGDAMMIV